VVTQSVAIKAQVVAADEREAGRRAVLNFGHTVGHAVETVAKFTVSHGEAVAIGMAAEARLAERLGLAERGTAERIARALKAYGLPFEVPGVASPDDLLAAMQHDKKVRAGAIRFALPARIGEMHGDARRGWTVTAPAAEVREALFSKH
jgi:3-dehydroquinate synthetase